MAREHRIVTTNDGSASIYIPELNVQYHSKHGAIAEAKHVFLKMGLFHFLNTNSVPSVLNILEIGFGTGLNAFLTLIESEKQLQNIYYKGIEAHPLKAEIYKLLNYPNLLDSTYKEAFANMHKADWELSVPIIKTFSLYKQQTDILKFSEVNSFHIIYFDAFAATAQPELWDETVFSKMFVALKNKGILVTYSAKGSVRRALQNVGFNVERLEGPPGKREMLRATKNK